ncbi:CarD family transcriptional regulator [Microbacterium caowuchunii]|uniref:CarD family transcriptional regulator n=1 Tax=Microbacterium caowuchunii TaxID=2614638 RepID=A0A5N0T789_9MICO|nr:CarD family transcriptional regulator [Microbacterium caowuchunii]
MTPSARAAPASPGIGYAPRAAPSAIRLPQLQRCRRTSYESRFLLLFSVGQTIAHPFHGLATVRSLRTRTVRGEARDYLDLEVAHDGLRISIPLDSADEVGVRALYTKATIDELFEVLRGPSEKYDKTWAHRIKQYRQRLVTGEGSAKAALVREIVRTKGVSPLPGAERELLDEARNALGEEFAAVLGVTFEDALGMINEAALAGAETVPPARTA